jgi:TonB-linked SusC/RagA family outer membrane protein
MKLHKPSFISYTLVACMFLHAPTVVGAQEKEDSSVVVIEHIQPEKTPGFLLSLSKERSIIPPATVTGQQLFKTPVANITNTLYGKLQGLVVRQRSGEPGYDNASLSIRGRGTYDNSSLVIFVDGFQTTTGYFSYISPNEIESITVLKDPVSLASFGMRGANGVLWVTTKRGGAQKQKVQASVVTGSQQPITLSKPYGSYDYARLYNQALSNDGYALNGNQFVWKPRFSDAELQAFQNGSGTNVDWFNEALRKTGRYTNANVALTGGDPGTKYAIVLDYMKHQGLYNVPTNDKTSNAQIQRFNIRTNLDFSFFKIFEAKIDLGGRIEERRYPNFNGPNLWDNMARYPSLIYPVKDKVSGAWSGTTLYPSNPVASLNALGWASTQDRTLQANFLVKQRLDFITKGLYLSEAVSFNTWTRSRSSKTSTYARYDNGIKTTNDNTTDISSNGTTPEDQYDWKQINLTAGYDRTVGRHAFSGALNYFASAFITDSDNNSQGYNSGNNIFYNFLNIGGRFNYTYNEKYIAEIGFGYSGSDNFSPSKQWVTYPSIGGGWILSKENFMKNSKLFSMLKLRGSAGLSGWDDTNNGRYLYQQYFVSNGSYNTGNNSLSSNAGLILSYTANPAISPEKSFKYDVGFDVSLLKGLDISFDLFKDSRSGIITQNNSIMAVFGGILPFVNLGKVVNKGFEISTNYNKKIGALTLSIGGMFSQFSNKIIEQAEVPPVNAYTKTTGLPIGALMGLVADGFYDISDFNSNGSLKAGMPTPSFGAVQPGDLKYKDLDKNGRVDQNDVTKIGSADYPSKTYSINMVLECKGFDFSAVVQGMAGNDINILSASNLQSVAFVNNTNVFPLAGNAWAYYPSQGIDTRSSANYPRLTLLANDNNYRSSSFWMKKNAFTRVRNMEIGYRFSSSSLKRLKMENLRVFVNAVNPFTWSSLADQYNIDPETNSGYPGMKSFNTGITLNF